MNDRYLYRAKRTDNGEWIVGFYHWTNWINPQTKEIVEVTHSILPIDCQDSYHVDPSTICQCTGLKDKNENLIFENDILSAYLDERYPEDITYAEVIWWRNGFYIREKGSNDVHEIDAFVEQNYEVAGNIFDNPELLEK